MNPRLGRILYVGIFGALLPAMLAAWAVLLDRKLPGLPAVGPVWAGALAAGAGAALMARAMADLWRMGRGLPMSAYPPEQLVTRGAYAWVPHPIYLGFGLLVAGAATAAGSPAGLWVVTPLTALAMVALVLGFERIVLERRFRGRPHPWLSTPEPGPGAPGTAERLRAASVAFLPWLVGYQACRVLTTPHATVDTFLPWEGTWPVWDETAVVYFGAYAWTALAPFAAATRDDLREFTRTSVWGTAACLLGFLVLPFRATPRPTDGESVFSQLLLVDRAWDTPACAFPSFHVFWGFAATLAWSSRIGRGPSLAVAAAIAASCVTTGTHSVADVVAGTAVFAVAAGRRRVWRWAVLAAERVANAWRDWRIGPVRILKHGSYVGAAAVLGVFIVGSALGRDHLPAVMTVALAALLGAGLWGQWLEASSLLSRPFGYFGGLFGGLLGVMGAHLVWGNGWELLGGFALAGPWIQATGRLRCLVQGCCHGRPVEPAWLGIRHTRPLSRVCRIAGLGGVPLHPTALYSIVGNVAIAGLLGRLWWEGADLPIISGAYLILSTSARFVEEGYRGEPQTVHWGGLAIYQWLAIGCLLAGIALTAAEGPARPPFTGADPLALAVALPFGLLVWTMMGVDFPESTRRMSRLA